MFRLGRKRRGIRGLNDDFISPGDVNSGGGGPTSTPGGNTLVPVTPGGGSSPLTPVPGGGGSPIFTQPTGQPATAGQYGTPAGPTTIHYAPPIVQPVNTPVTPGITIPGGPANVAFTNPSGGATAPSNLVDPTQNAGYSTYVGDPAAVAASQVQPDPTPIYIAPDPTQPGKAILAPYDPNSSPITARPKPAKPVARPKPIALPKPVYTPPMYTPPVAKPVPQTSFTIVTPPVPKPIARPLPPTSFTVVTPPTPVYHNPEPVTPPPAPVVQPQPVQPGPAYAGLSRITDATAPTVLSHGITLVFFHGPNCGVCTTMIRSGILTQISRANNGVAQVVDYYVTDSNQALWKQYADLMPAYVVFNNGVAVSTTVGTAKGYDNAHTGPMSAAQLQSMINQARGGAGVTGPSEIAYAPPAAQPAPPAPVPQPAPVYSSGPTQSGSGAEHANESDFTTDVGGQGVTTLVIYHASWCVPCRKIMPVVNAAADYLRSQTGGVMNGNYRIVEVDVDESPNISSWTHSVPAYRLFKNGQVVSQGYPTADIINQMRVNSAPTVAPVVAAVAPPPPQPVYVPPPPPPPAQPVSNVASGYQLVYGANNKPMYLDLANDYVISEATYKQRIGQTAVAKPKPKPTPYKPSNALTNSFVAMGKEITSLEQTFRQFETYGNHFAAVVAAPMMSVASGTRTWPTKPTRPKMPSSIAMRPASIAKPSATAILDQVHAAGEVASADLTGNVRTPSTGSPDSPLSVSSQQQQQPSVTVNYQPLQKQAQAVQTSINRLKSRISELTIKKRFIALNVQNMLSDAFTLPAGPVHRDAVYSALQALPAILNSKFGAMGGSNDPDAAWVKSQLTQQLTPLLRDFAPRANGDVDNPLREFSESGANSSTDRDGYNYAQAQARQNFDDQKQVFNGLTQQAISNVLSQMDAQIAQLQTRQNALIAQRDVINAQLTPELRVGTGGGGGGIFDTLMKAIF